MEYQACDNKPVVFNLPTTFFKVIATSYDHNLLHLYLQVKQSLQDSKVQKIPSWCLSLIMKSDGFYQKLKAHSI